MTDSPAIHLPLDPKEQPILDRVIGLRDQLFLLKQDKSTYIKSQDVIAIYDRIIEEVHLLNTLRAEHGKPLELNRGWYSRTIWTGPHAKRLLESVDRVLEDCFQLISLFFLTVGRNNEAPAVYVSVILMKLNHTCRY